MTENRVLTMQESKKLHSTIQNVEFTGDQLAVLVNALSFSLLHNDCMTKDNSYGVVYHEESHNLYDYLDGYIKNILGEINDNKKIEKK
jgi:hypothetical protein